MTAGLADLLTRCRELKPDMLAEADHLMAVVKASAPEGSLHSAEAAAVVSNLLVLVADIEKLTVSVRLTQRIADALGVCE